MNEMLDNISSAAPEGAYSPDGAGPSWPASSIRLTLLTGILRSRLQPAAIYEK